MQRSSPLAVLATLALGLFLIGCDSGASTDTVAAVGQSGSISAKESPTISGPDVINECVATYNTWWVGEKYEYDLVATGPVAVVDYVEYDEGRPDHVYATLKLTGTGNGTATLCLAQTGFAPGSCAATRQVQVAGVVC